MRQLIIGDKKTGKTTYMYMLYILYKVGIDNDLSYNEYSRSPHTTILPEVDGDFQILTHRSNGRPIPERFDIRRLIDNKLYLNKYPATTEVHQFFEYEFSIKQYTTNHTISLLDLSGDVMATVLRTKSLWDVPPRSNYSDDESIENNPTFIEWKKKFIKHYMAKTHEHLFLARQQIKEIDVVLQTDKSLSKDEIKRFENRRANLQDLELGLEKDLNRYYMSDGGYLQVLSITAKYAYIFACQLSESDNILLLIDSTRECEFERTIENELILSAYRYVTEHITEHMINRRKLIIGLSKVDESVPLSNELKIDMGHKIMFVDREKLDYPEDLKRFLSDIRAEIYPISAMAANIVAHDMPGAQDNFRTKTIQFTVKDGENETIEQIEIPLCFGVFLPTQKFMGG